MNTLLKQVYKKTAGKRADWIDLNSIQVVGTNKLLLSSKKLSSIFKVSNVGSILPKINYIIADKKLYKSYKGFKQKKVLTKSMEHHLHRHSRLLQKVHREKIFCIKK